LVEEWAEAQVLNEVVLAAVGVVFVGGVLPEPFDVFADGFFFGGEVGGVDWARASGGARLRRAASWRRRFILIRRPKNKYRGPSLRSG